MENTQPISKSRLWSGRIISTLAILFMLFDGVIHFMEIPAVTQGFAQMGYSLKYYPPFGNCRTNFHYFIRYPPNFYAWRNFTDRIPGWSRR